MLMIIIIIIIITLTLMINNLYSALRKGFKALYKT